MGTRPRLVIFSGPSGVGKSTLISRFVQTDKINFIVPSTTRPMRANEVDGVDYKFCERQVFRDKIRSGEMPHWDYALDSYYGFDRSIQTTPGITHALARMALRIKENIPDTKLVFLRPADPEAHFQRLETLFTDKRQFHARIAHFEEEIAHASLFDHVLRLSVADDAVGEHWDYIWNILGLGSSVE